MKPARREVNLSWTWEKFGSDGGSGSLSESDANVVDVLFVLEIIEVEVAELEVDEFNPWEFGSEDIGACGAEDACRLVAWFVEVAGSAFASDWLGVGWLGVESLTGTWASTKIKSKM